MVNVEQLLEKDAFRRLEPEQAALFRELVVRLDGRNGMEILPVLMDYSKKAAKYKQYGKDEQNAMLDAFYEALPEEERGGFQNVMKMLRLMNK